VAVISGIPALIAVIGFAVLGIRNGVHAFRRGRDAWQRQVGLAVAAAITGIMIHNMVDETFRLPFAMNVFWVLSGATAMLVKRAAAFLPVPIAGGTAVRAVAPVPYKALGAGR
jgi:hypothetical protein